MIVSVYARRHLRIQAKGTLISVEREHRSDQRIKERSFYCSCSASVNCPMTSRIDSILSLSGFALRIR